MLTQNNMRGVLFKKEKEKESQPDYHGNALINGKHYWMAGWIEEKDGLKRLAIRFDIVEDKEL